jgi:hypothetical protein
VIFTMIREVRGDTYFVPDGYMGGYLTCAIFFGIISYKTRPRRGTPSAPNRDAAPDSDLRDHSYPPST